MFIFSIKTGKAFFMFKITARSSLRKGKDTLTYLKNRKGISAQNSTVGIYLQIVLTAYLNALIYE